MSKCQCGGETEAGFIPDFGMFAVWTAIWLPGEPNLDKGVWDRFRTGAGIGTEVPGARMLEAHRCRKCGLLQIYALQKPPEGMSPA